MNGAEPGTPPGGAEALAPEDPAREALAPEDPAREAVVDDAPAASSPGPAAPRWRRWVPLALGLGLAAALAPVAESWPSTHVLLVTPEPLDDVVAVSLEVGPAGEEALLSTRWTFDQGRASERLRAELRGPDGLYEATVVVERAGQAPSSRVHHLDLDGERVVTLFAR